MGIRFARSVGKHGISVTDALCAVLHAEGADRVEGLPGQDTRVFVGHPHAQTDRWIEVIAARTARGEFVVFHAMELSDLYRHLIED